MTNPKKPKWCLDCKREDDDTQWCDVCEGFICLDCRDAHDCLEEILADDEDDEDVVALFDAIMDDDEDDDGSSDA